MFSGLSRYSDFSPGLLAKSSIPAMMVPLSVKDFGFNPEFERLFNSYQSKWIRQPISQHDR